MKKQTRYFMRIVMLSALLSMTGCGSEKPQEVTGTVSSAAEFSETKSSAAVGETYESMPETSPAESAETLEETSEEGMSEAEREAKEKYEYWDAHCNFNPLDLTPMEGDYMAFNPEAEDAFPYMVSPDGEAYGFYEDLTDGCSVWCVIDTETYVNRISATSTLEPQGDNTYDAANLADGWRGDAWVEGAEGNGIGESVTIVRKYSHGGDVTDFEDYGYDSFFFPNLCIVNGMTKNETAFRNNGRVKSLKLYFNEEYIATLELEDSMRPQFISLSGLHLSARDGEESTFRFEIAEVYPGDKYEDTAITGIEIEVFTENH